MCRYALGKLGPSSCQRAGHRQASREGGGEGTEGGKRTAEERRSIKEEKVKVKAKRAEEKEQREQQAKSGYRCAIAAHLCRGRRARTQRAPQAGDEERSEHAHRLCGCAGGVEQGRCEHREEVPFGEQSEQSKPRS
ncbi:hypothetical protein NDU88_003006 [Pleurodeles waltl]|uniref:Uncharacterized protein n=1 Tax=Pleurodeles waltl TaxID=8319 RepID=A0AAV7M288_PLEWA|nr:hypothetical protein NDU88_003006 [Pleurodeles waltl]